MANISTTSSEKETIELANNYSQKLRGGEIIGLIGELGAGKTVFTKGLAKGLGIKKHITSPTFILMNVYEVRNKKSEVKNFVHIDAYRINKPEELNAIGIQDYFNRDDCIVVIEWADKIKKILPKRTRFIKLQHQEKKQRLITEQDF
jgi:tRNA threonylcarbamoyladenosine biosynthesis protein TsaE